MRRLQRQTLFTHANGLDVRVEALERRIPSDFPQWAGCGYDALSGIQTAGAYEFDPTFPNDDPCVLPDCDPDDWRITSDGYLLAPTGYNGVLHCYLYALLLGGNTNLDDYYTVVDAADQSINGQCRLRLIVEVWRNDAPFGFATLRAYWSWDEYPPPTGMSPIDRMWVHDTIVANSSTFMNLETDRYAMKLVFDVNQDLPGPIQVQPNLAVEAGVPGTLIAGTSLS